MICLHCNHAIPEHREFCPVCGQTIAASEDKTGEAACKPQKSVWATVGSVSVSILLFTLILLCLIWISARSLLSAKGVERVVSQVDIIDLADGYIDTLYENMNPMAKDSIDESSLRALLQEESVKTFISLQLSTFIGAFLSGDDAYALPKDQIVGFLENSQDLIERRTGYRLSDEDYAALDAYLSENTESYRAGALLEASPLGAARFFLSVITMVVAILLCLLCGFLLYFLQKRHINTNASMTPALRQRALNRALLLGSAVLEAAGFLCVLLGLLLGIFLRIPGIPTVVIQDIAALAGSYTLASGLWALGAGALMMVVYVVVSVVINSRKTSKEVVK